ncbi:hypothetical protein BpHYR1_051076 [Brachionus plicatilis]|uniref:Uncharacterized protein n=1 Tax=Brachionus plicatilis TaxID=10195 RepID=A0A3M7QV80_BRAPC|nr:hypothetical protein BpHYR1_051076 [Brachionus plicatilis]
MTWSWSCCCSWAEPAKGTNPLFMEAMAGGLERGMGTNGNWLWVWTDNGLSRFWTARDNAFTLSDFLPTTPVELTDAISNEMAARKSFSVFTSVGFCSSHRLLKTCQILSIRHKFGFADFFNIKEVLQKINSLWINELRTYDLTLKSNNNIAF